MVLVFRKGDNFVSEFKKIARSRKIISGFFVGIGSFVNPELAFYDLTTKQYHTTKFEGLFEVVNLTGDITEFNGDLVIHCHATLSDKTFQTFGGHVVSAEVGGTLEVFFTQTENLNRVHDGETGLKLIQ